VNEFCLIVLGGYGLGRSVGIATDYGLDGPGIESRWGRDFPHPSRLALGPTQPPIQRVPSLSGEVKRPGRGADHPPLLAPRLRMRSYTSAPPLGHEACYRVNFTFTIRT
jgi:hypothetical protein